LADEQDAAIRAAQASAGRAPAGHASAGHAPAGHAPAGQTARAAQAARAAAAFQPPLPGRQRERRRVGGTAALALLVVAVLGFAGYEFAANAGHARRPVAVAHPGARATTVPLRTPSPSAVSTPPVSQSPVASASPPPQVLAPASVAAFGPAGLADGENPHYAALAVSGHPGTPWYSYVSASPGLPGPAPGTGLLLDMGRTVTITSVRVSMVGKAGAAVQLRAGRESLLSSLPQVAAVSGAGDRVLLAPRAPVSVRYVLIWFTQLPPDRAGTYQAAVYQVTVQGQP
jgi:hypothetical protein